MTMNPVFADFSATPVRSGNADVRSEEARRGHDHWNLAPGGTVWIDFVVDAPIPEATLRVRALVSKLGAESGYAPLDVLVNGEPIATRLRIPGGGDLPQHLTFAIPGNHLHTGTNTVALRSGTDAVTLLWLYHVQIESVWDRDAAERAMLADQATRSTFTFATHTRALDDAHWLPGQPLTCHVDECRSAIPAELSWRCADGSEGSISFATEMTTFLGTVRTPDGEWRQLRGVLTDRRALPDAPVMRFRTAVEWGGGWHRADELALYLDVGDVPVEFVRWRDQLGNSAAIGLTGDAGEFLGYAQRRHEGPIGYRGSRQN